MTLTNRKRTTLRTLSLSIVLALIGGTALALAYDGLSTGNLLPGTRIGGVAVGSRSVEEAQALVYEHAVRPLQKHPVTLRAHETLRASAWDIGLRIDSAEAVRSVYDRQRSIPMLTRMWRRAFGDETRNPLQGDVNDATLGSFLSETATRIDRPAKDATVEVQGERLSVIPHRVGRRLDVDRARPHLISALRAGDTDIRLPVEITQPELRTEQFVKVVFVRTSTNRLDLYVDGKVSKSFPVATGTPGYATPHGTFHITAKRKNPTWGNPWAPWSMDMPAFIGPGPGNPLGTRAMNLSVGGIRIHGSPDAASIGRPASHGCIRMHLRDAEELFELVDVGTPVVIVGA